MSKEHICMYLEPVEIELMEEIKQLTNMEKGGLLNDLQLLKADEHINEMDKGSSTWNEKHTNTCIKD